MTDKLNINENIETIFRRDFLKTVAFGVAGFSLISIPMNVEGKTINKYGLYGKLQAKTGKGAELGEILLKAAKLMENAKGCVLYIVNKVAAEPDAVYIIEVWNSKEDHDNSLNVKGVRELITQALPILDGKPEGGMTLEVLGGKGIK